MGPDYSTFSIRDALGPQVVSSQLSLMTATVVPQEYTFAEQETFLLRNQADAPQNSDDVDTASCPTHHSFNPSPQHAHLISPLLSFSHTPEDYVPTHPGFVHNTSSAHGYQEHDLQEPFVACHQLQLPDSTYPFSEIALAPAGQQSSEDQLTEADNFSGTAGQGHQCDALSLDTTFPHFDSNIDDDNAITQTTSPPFSLDSIDSARPPWNYHHIELHHHHHPTHHVASFPFPVDYSFPGSYSLDTISVHHLSQSNTQEGQQLDSLSWDFPWTIPAITLH
ncbi:uncharacterized protein EDB91DRAFT_341330 [Suillus paluster]|uniref:uncharacterized protein n=1 Tax=Suillus paluster TaxID=48578 RepID=UPI001B870694|nr:uncharacterized protein EDB91DRAFT_341330 [Suillus paluster]KAG1740840.1 hypothetical protein EDB91DRAFT_341330 [Suillus paluster]